MEYYFSRISICLCSYFIIWPIVVGRCGSNDATDGYKGKYGHGPNRYEIVVPTKVNENAEFVSHRIPHRHQPFFHKKTNKREMGHVLNYIVPIAGENHHLQLYPSNNILSPGVVVETHNNEPISKRKIRKLRNEQCHYTGSVKGQEDSRVALSTCYGLTGYVRTKRGLFFIEPTQDHNPLVDKYHKHLLYQDGSDRHSLGLNCDTVGNLAKILSKRSSCENYDPHYDDPNQKFPVEFHVETLIVLDKMMLNYHKDVDVENYVMTVFNMARSIFHDSTLKTNINLALVRIIRLEEEEHELNLAINKDAKKTLEYFSQWQHGMNPEDDAHPNHHDVAILLTRIDICGDKNCGLLGTSKLGGMCDAKYSVALCQDNGLRLGFIIAHEIAHTLAIPHDTPKESGCKATLPGGLSTVMNPSVNIKTSGWSTCSSKYLSLFIDQGLAACLADLPTDHTFLLPDILPGVMYGGDFQCRQFFGPNAALCNTGIECDNLICYIEDKGCVETRTPAAPGTNCGERKWCLRDKCVGIGEQPFGIHGGWANWSDWSACSRSCGSGVSSRSRTCTNPAPSEGGMPCLGNTRVHRLCNTEPCPLGKPKFRDVQCAEFNDWLYPEDNKGHYWNAYYMADENPCVLFCENEDGDVAALKPRVIDGTKCYRGMRDICVEGFCKEIPCDLDLESNAIEDWCGVCRGNGTTCKVVEGQVTVQESTCNDVNMFLLTIPAMSVKINIEEAEPSESQIQVRSEKGDIIYVVGDSLGMFDVPGSKVWVGSIRTKQQALIIPGPIRVALSIWIVTIDNGVIKYSFGVKECTPRTPSFYWNYIDWTRCSTVCGPGIQETIPKCLERVAGLVDDSNCVHIEKPKENIRPCELAPCIARWYIGTWQSCKCTAETRQRIVKCIRPTGQGEGEISVISEIDCPNPKPRYIEQCTCTPADREREKFRDKSKCVPIGLSCSHFTNDTDMDCGGLGQLNSLIVDKEDTKDLVLIAHQENDEEFNYPTRKSTTVVYGMAALRYLNRMQKDYSYNKTRV